MAHIEQGAVVMLPVNLGQHRPDLTQQRDADRLIVDESAAQAVAALDPPQHDLAISRDLPWPSRRAKASCPGGGVKTAVTMPLTAP